MEFDVKCMSEAVDWARDCKPIKDSIPKVGAIIAVDDAVIGRGRRGTGREGDDQHAEWLALNEVTQKDKLPRATLYTTLEPCTRAVRTNELECCTELILQHRVKRVFVGILDPNQGVTGKGLSRLQENNINVSLFPHELAQKIRALNAPFVRAQSTLGATIVSPANDEILRTYETQGKHAVRFTCLNPPGTDNYLLVFRQGLCWPSGGSFRQIDDRTWEIDANFGSTGPHTLHLVTANDLGRTLIEYYRKVVRSNLDRREKVTAGLGNEAARFLGGDYPGIQMNGLPKGIRAEASINVTIAERA